MEVVGGIEMVSYEDAEAYLDGSVDYTDTWKDRQFVGLRLADCLNREPETSLHGAMKKVCSFEWQMWRKRHVSD